MKNFNWLVKLIFYKHRENNAVSDGKKGVFYRVGFIDQTHANLCTNASENMLNHYAGKPFSSMVFNPRGIMEGCEPNCSEYENKFIDINDFEEILKSDGPFIMALPLKYGFYHSVVVTGYVNGQIIYNDPLTGPHKVITSEELENLCNGKKIQIAAASFFNKFDVKARIQKVLPQIPESISLKKYGEFFDIKSMNNPCSAILNFMNDYSKFYLWNLGRNHRREVSLFVDQNKNVTDLKILLKNIDNFLYEKNINKKGELFNRISTLGYLFNYRFFNVKNNQEDREKPQESPHFK